MQKQKGLYFPQFAAKVLGLMLYGDPYHHDGGGQSSRLVAHSFQLLHGSH